MRRLAAAALVLATLVAAAALAADRAVAACGAASTADLARLPRCHAALVLGTAWRGGGGRPNAWFANRMDAAAALWAAGKAEVLIVSGDNRRRDYDEPAAMRAALLARGVPDAAIVRDCAGFHTLDSVLRARSVFGQERLIVVSQRFHTERAIYIARANGIAVVGYEAADAPRRGLRMRARELLSRLACLIDVHLRHARPRFAGPPQPI